MPREPRTKRASESLRHNPLSRLSNQAAESDTQTKVESMLWSTYVRLGKTILATDCSVQKQRRVCELTQGHFQRWDPIGGINKVNDILTELGIDTSSLVKNGMLLKEWCNDLTFDALDDFGREMAERVNGITKGIKASTAGEGGSLGQPFSKAFRFVMENKARLSKARQAVLENKTRLSKAFRVVMDHKTLFSTAFPGAMENKTPAVLMAVVVAVGVMLARGRRPGERNVLNPGGTEDDDDDNSDFVDGSETDAGGDCGDNGDQSIERDRDPRWLVTLDEPSEADRTTEDSFRWTWGCLLPGEQNVRVAFDGQVYYQVVAPSSTTILAGSGPIRFNQVGCRADRMRFLDGEAFDGHDLRKRVKV